MRIVGVILLAVLCLNIQAQPNPELATLVETKDYPNLIFIAPNPPKPIKGWNLENKMYSGEQQTVLKGEYPGEIIKFRFKGTAIGILVYSDNNSGIIEYSLDGQPWFEQDVYSANKASELKSYILDKDLKNRKHTLQIRIVEKRNPESSGTSIALRSFYFNKE